MKRQVKTENDSEKGGIYYVSKCGNTLNLALNAAKRSWSMNHTGDIEGKMKEAKATYLSASRPLIL